MPIDATPPLTATSIDVRGVAACESVARTVNVSPASPMTVSENEPSGAALTGAVTAPVRVLTATILIGGSASVTAPAGALIVLVLAEIRAICERSEGVKTGADSLNIGEAVSLSTGLVTAIRSLERVVVLRSLMLSKR